MRLFVPVVVLAASLVAGCSSIPGLSIQQEQVEENAQWEYRIERDDGDTPMTSSRATAIGSEGWEMVAVVHNTSPDGWYNEYTFKRRKKKIDNSGVPTVSPSN